MDADTSRWIGRPETQSLRAHACTDLEPLIERLLAARGFSDEESIRRFLNPRMKHLHAPESLAGVEGACDSILERVRGREPIVIYGDYDVDGVTASAILLRTLRHIAPNADVRSYIPHRVDEGYGLNVGAIAALAERGARLIITVDCGVNAVESAQRCRELGVELIITDHHLPPADGAPSPLCAALVHPMVGEPGYPCPDLCGAGVAFKLAWALLSRHEGRATLSPPSRSLLLDCLSLAALGTIADVVPLRDENRVIARFGLSRLRDCAIPGVRALIDATDVRGSISAEHVGFVLGPRLNACGRMGHASEALELLETDEQERAHTLANALTRLNDERRAAERRITEHALELAREAGMDGADRRAVVLAHEDWHPGVIGIVCSRLVERLRRPVALLQRQGDVCVGSCRSVDGFHILDALDQCADLLLSHGGHAMAGGLRLESTKLGELTRRLTDIANQSLGEEDLTRSFAYDCEADLSELNERTVRQLARLGPFGRGNEAPVIRVNGLELVRDAQTIGAHGRHLALMCRRGERMIRLMGWGWGDRAVEFRQRDRIDALIRPRLNEFRGRVSVEAELRDVRASANDAARVESVSAPSPIPS